MPGISLPIKFLLTLVLGAIIGLERESSFDNSVKGKNIGKLGGIRTFSIISLLGGVAGFLSIVQNPILSTAIVVTFFTLIVAYYVLGGTLTKALGLTTELSAIFTFLIGFFVTSEILSIQMIIALTVVLGLILSIKEKAKLFVLGVHKTELNAFLGFAIIALVILPFLPNKGFFLTNFDAIKTLLGAYDFDYSILEKIEIINPFKLWLIVALITGIDVVGYLLGKFIGKGKGILLSSTIGGFISSTSTTQSLAQQSKKSNRINELVSAAIFANLASFLQIFVLVAPLNSRLLVFITPTLLFIVASALISGLFFSLKRKKGEESKTSSKEIEKDTIFSLAPALKFAGLLVGIRILTKVSLVVFGQSGFMASSVIASLAGIDAIVINLTELAGQEIIFTTALMTLILVNATNLGSKAIYTFIQGKREFALKFTASMAIIVASSFIGYFLAI